MTDGGTIYPLSHVSPTDAQRLNWHFVMSDALAAIAAAPETPFTAVLEGLPLGDQRRDVRITFSVAEEEAAPIRQCGVCGGYDGEHDWEVHSAELRAGG